jgi:hypothetical protein
LDENKCPNTRTAAKTAPGQHAARGMSRFKYLSMDLGTCLAFNADIVVVFVVSCNNFASIIQILYIYVCFLIVMLT